MSCEHRQHQKCNALSGMKGTTNISQSFQLSIPPVLGFLPILPHSFTDLIFCQRYSLLLISGCAIQLHSVAYLVLRLLFQIIPQVFYKIFSDITGQSIAPLVTHTHQISDTWITPKAPYSHHPETGKCQYCVLLGHAAQNSESDQQLTISFYTKLHYTDVQPL